MKESLRSKIILPRDPHGENYQTKVSDESKVQITLNGMERTIESAISTHALKTLDDVKQLTFRRSSFKSNGKVTEQPAVAVASPIPSKFETSVEVLTAAVAKLATAVEVQEAGPD